MRILRTVLSTLLGHTVNAASGGQRRNTDTQMVYNVQTLPTDGAGGAKNTYTIYHIISPLQAAAEATLLS